MKLPFIRKTVFIVFYSLVFVMLNMGSQCPPGLDSDSTFNSHSCVITSANFVRCWGGNLAGQLGYGHTIEVGRHQETVANSRGCRRAQDDDIYGSPAKAGDVNVGNAVTQIAVGMEHTCALLSGGTVRCWGANEHGELGYGHTNHIGMRESPASAGDVNLGGAVTQIAVGSSHTCALLTGGTVRCWGKNEYGQLGYGHTNNIGDDESPASAGDVNIGGSVTQIAAGYFHTCALLTGGAVRCWGGNRSTGKLGYGHTNDIGDDEYPVSAGDVNVGESVTQIAAGAFHTCALLTGGTVRCWGSNGSTGKLGYGHTNDIGDDEYPASAGDVNIGGSVTQIAVGWIHTCALLTGGTVRCWGFNKWGQLGYGHTNNIGDDESPASAGDVNLGSAVMQLAITYSYTCALLTGGTVRCWGNKKYDRTNSVGDDETPASTGDVNIGEAVIKLWGDLLR